MKSRLPVLWLLLLQAYLVNALPRVTSLSIGRGSLNGGTKLYIYGKEFAAEQGSRMLGNEGTGNRVWLQSSTAAVECDVETYYTTTVQIVCNTRPAPEGTIIVEVNGVLADSSSCRCDFTYTWRQTPTVQAVSPSSGPPGTVLEITGKLFTAFINSAQLERDEIDEKKSDRKIVRAYWGKNPCNIADEAGELYNVSLKNGGTSNFGSLKCKQNGTSIASQPVSFQVSKNFGWSRAETDSLLVSGKNELYHFQSHAVIHSIEPAEGNTAGGQLVTITGNYFADDTNPVVFIGGTPCEVRDVKATTIQCVTGPKDSNMTGFPGSRGMNKEVWLDYFVHDLYNAVLNESSDDFRFEYVDNAWFGENRSLNEPDRFIGRLRGFYIPPRDGYYKFSVVCDDRSRLFFSNTSRAEDKVEIAYCPSWGWDYHRFPEATSSKIYLEGGRPYYIEALMLDYGGPGGVAIGVHSYDTPFVRSLVRSAVNEKQSISVTSVRQNEVQTLTRVANITESQVMIVTYDDNCTDVATCAPAPKFKMSFMGQETGEFAVGVDPMDIETALNALPAIQPIGVEVYASKDESEDRLYYISFNRSTENLPEIEATVVEGMANITIQEYQYGVPPFEDSFSIVLDGVTSAPVSFASTAEEVRSVMLDMITVKCERTTSASPLYAQDYEGETSGYETGTRTSGAEPFCGRASLMNPGLIFNAGETETDDGVPIGEFNALVNKQLCYAYRGAIRDQIKLKVAWVDQERKERSDTLLGNVDTSNTKTWQHICVDLEETIIGSGIADGFRTTGGLNVRTIELLGDSHEGYYIDNLYIGRNPDNYMRTSRAPKPNDIFILNITVEKPSDDSFTFTFEPAACGSDFPLIGIVGANTSGGAPSGDWVEYMSESWPLNVTIIVTRDQSASLPIGGTFDLTQEGVVIEGVAVNTSATKMKSILQAYFGVGTVEVERTGSCSGYQWDITWMSKGGSQPLIEVDDAAVTGNLVNSSSQKLEEGSLFQGPIPGEFLRTYHHTPQVEVLINGIPSLCDCNCRYNYSDDATPSLTGVTPTTGTGCDSTSITISGTGFSATPANNTVRVGGQECEVTASTETSITCTIGITETGNYTLSVQVEGKGYATHPNGNVTFTHELQVTSFSPTMGSSAGGTTVSVSGCGFSFEPSKVSISVGGLECEITSASYEEIVCVVKLDENNSTRKHRSMDVAVVVEVNGVTKESESTFTFSDALTPIIESMSPSSSPVLGGDTLTLTGSNFTMSDAIEVTIGGAPCEISTQTDTEITCVIPPNDPGSYNIQLKVGNVGYADVKAIDKFKYLLKVKGVFPSQGSTMGGTLLTIKGEGFGTDQGEVAVDLEGRACEVQTVSDEKITCMTTSPAQVHKVTNNGRHERYGVGYKWSREVLKIRAGDTVAWEWAVPTHVVGIAYTVQQTPDADSTTFDGTGFYAGPATSIGSYSYTFTAPGTYFYSSGPVDPQGNIIMNGTIHVLEAVGEACQLEVTVGNYSALHSPGSASSDALDSCTIDSNVGGCTKGRPEGSDASSVYFSYYECSTPTVKEITPIHGTSEDDIVIRGQGFGDMACQHNVQFGDHSCVLSSANSTTLTCKLNTSGEPSVGYWMELSLMVTNLGYAGILINNPSQRSFTLVPYIGSISHTIGSTAGGLKVTITGTGFSASNTSFISITIGGVSCAVDSYTYTSIVCTTGAKSAGNCSVTGLINSIPAVVETSVTFEYSEAVTTTLTAVSPSSFEGSSTTLSIEGANFPSSADDISVTVGGVDCSVSPVAADSPNITCDIGHVPVGTHDAIVNIADRGNAAVNGASTQVESRALLTSVTPNIGSKMGGQLITIAGNGFVVNDTEVVIDGIECAIQTMTISEIKCVTPKLSEGDYNIEVTSSGIAYNTLTYETSAEATPKILSVSPTAGASGDTITITGLLFTNVTEDLVVTLDGVPCVVTSAAEDSIECTVGEHSAGTFPLVVIRDMYGYAAGDVRFEYSLTVSAAPVECGFGGGITLSLTGAGFDEDNIVVYVCDRRCSTYNVSSTEVTCDVPGMTESGATLVCDITVSLPDIGVNTTVTDGVTYRSSLTSTISEVSPRRGGTGGGTTVNITGTSFAASGNKVTIAGTVCVVQSESATEIVCTTGAHSPTEMAKIRVDVGASGIAVQDNADFFYIDLWSSVYSWGGKKPPREGETVIIPAGNTILLDQTTPVLRMLLLQGGHLVFDEKDIELHAEYIIITDGGSLTVGTEDEPFQHQATIMMHGHVRSQGLPMFGAKVLAVRNGTLDLHGQPVAVTWTHLAATVNPGDMEMTLKQPVDWKVDDQIVIATTSHRHSQRESEVVNITGISADKRTLTFTPELKYKHISLIQTIDGVTLETRAEVGLLTHNVKFMGSVHDKWTEKIDACEKTFNTNQFATQTCFQGRFGEETGSDQYGAHIMLFAKEMDKDLIKGRISYIEVTHAGQAFRLGRYPIHFHMSGDITGSYVRGCGIHNTFNRAVTVHGVHGFLVEHNVAYNVMGHAFFLEDGIESGNTLQYNLAIFVRSSSSLLNVDITPAAYWITNPNNTVRHNAAAGGSHFGFWYNAPVNPEGPSYTPHILPRNLPLGQFFNNSVHSQGWYGIWIFPTYRPSEPARFDSLTAWEVERGAEAVDVGRVQFHNFLISDAEASGLEYQSVDAPWGVTGAYINNSVVIGYSDVNDNNGNGKCTSTGVQLPKSKFLTVDGVKFINFDRDCYAIEACGHCKDFQGGFQTRFKNIEWSNAPNKAKFKWEHEAWFEDLDGTLTEKGPDYIILPQTGLLPPDNCQMNVGHSSNGKVPGAVCDSTVKMHRMAWNKVSPSSLKYKDVILENAHGNSSVPYRKKRLTHPEGWMATVMESDNVNMRFENVEHVTNISYNARFDDFADGEYLYVTHNFTQRPDMFALIGVISNGTEDIPDPADSAHGDFTFNNDTRQLTYIVTGNGETEPQDKSVDLDVYRCYYKDCIVPRPEPPPAERPAEYRLWSNMNSWEDAPEGWGGNKGDGVFGLPGEGDNVQIPQGVWMVADVPLPTMNKLVIYGTLEIEDTQDQVINATYIFIHGGRLVAGLSETQPFTHNLHFILQGNHLTPDMPLPDGPNMGSKVLGVFGGLDLHGVTRDVTWTHLASSALPGEDTIQLAEETDWVAGDEIVVTTTTYDAWHTETFNITERISGSNFKLNGSFQYKHIAETHQLSNGSKEYTLAAEVGLLTRNIRIEGADYPGLFSESFGARVLVGNFYQDGEEFIGYARISNVEFKHTGQEGWTDYYDPRYSLAFLDTGEVTDDRPSFVKGCSFHNGFSTAIGVYGTHGLEVSDNVIHHVVGPGIVAWGEDNRIIHNLVTLVIFPGTYQGRDEPENLQFNGGIEVEEAQNPVLINNTVAGSERVGFKVKGELCDGADGSWYGNTAHSTLQGVHLFKESQPECSRVSNFYIWNSFDYAIYAQISSSLLVTDSALVDNSAGILALVMKPPALSHQASDKFVEVLDTLMVGTSPSYDCNHATPDAAVSADQPSPKASGVSTVGIYVQNFMSRFNGAPTKPFSRVNNYPAISGITRLNGVTFSNYGSACGKKQVAIITNKESHDASHPMEVESLSFVDVKRSSYLFIHRPSLGKVNPSDCVDMDCDGMKKTIIRDLDGSLLGSKGTVIPESEFEWDRDLQRGLGDYRIPKTMLTRPNGSRIPANDLAPNKGIYRGSGNCEWISAWQAYECHNLDHMMMVIESMDADTETRRVSPVALLADGYVDLINGPQDNGWCLGYTCQERISTFYSVVDTGKKYDLHFTGTNPQHLRYHLLHADSSQSLVVATYYTNPQRLDVYVNGVYVLPTNGAMENGVFTWKAPKADETNADYHPSLESTVLGENYFDRDLRQLFVLIRGSDVVEVRTSPVIMTTFGVPAVEVDNFFEENLVQNLANLLNIPISKIRIVEIISENSSSRRRRAAGEVEVVVEIGDPPASSIESDTGSNATEAMTTMLPGDDSEPLSYEVLLEVQSTIVDKAQTGELSKDIGYSVTSLTMTDPVDTPVDPTGGVRATNTTGGSADETGPRYDERQAMEEALEAEERAPQEYRTPSQIIVVQEPGDAKESHPFHQQPKLKVVDALGNLVEHLGHASNPWKLEVTLRANDTGAALISNDTYSFTDGWLNFTNLAVNATGSGFILDYTIVHPNTTDLSASSAAFEVEVRPLGLRVVNDMPNVVVRDTFDIIVQMVDSLTGDDVTDLQEKGYDLWTAEASLYMPGNYRGSLDGDLSVTFDLSTGQAAFSPLTITSTGVSYLISVTVSTDPSSAYTFTQTLEGFNLVDRNPVTYSGETATVTARFVGDYATVAAGQEEGIRIYFLNQIVADYPNATFSNVRISEGSILIAFDVTGDVDGVVAAIWDDIVGGQLILNYNGHALPADTILLVDGSDYTGPTATSAGLPIWAIILAVVIFILMVVIILLVGYILFIRKGKTHKYGVPQPVEGAKSSSSVVELRLLDKSKEDIRENVKVASPTPSIMVNDDSQNLLNTSTSSLKDDASTGSRSPRLNKPRRSPELGVTHLPPGFTEGQYVYEKEDISELFVMVKNLDGTFQKLGSAKVNMVGTIQDVREELLANALPPKVRDRPFILMDEKLQDITPEKEKTLVVSEVYAGETVLMRWVLDEDSKKVCICGLVGQFSCSLCQKQSYCSPLCQSKDWPRHSLQCTIYSGEI